MTITIGQHLTIAMSDAVAIIGIGALVAGTTYIASRAESIGLAIAEALDALRGKRNA